MPLLLVTLPFLTPVLPFAVALVPCFALSDLLLVALAERFVLLFPVVLAGLDLAVLVDFLPVPLAAALMFSFAPLLPQACWQQILLDESEQPSCLLPGKQMLVLLLHHTFRGFTFRTNTSTYDQSDDAC